MLKAAAPGLNRRTFLSRIGVGAAFVSVAGFLVATARFVFPNVLYEAPSRVPLGPPDRFPPGEATYLPEERIFVFRDDDGLSALSSVCTHLGCNVRRVSSGFECPCHGSRFDAGGRVSHGPAPKPLAWRRLSLSPRGLVVVDLASEVERTSRLRV
jgi:menaquinol-cytochrome c reductase iron-sulfur subunit